MTPLESFRSRYKISSNANIDSVATAIESVCEANRIAYEYFGNIDSKTEKEGFVVRVHLNILGRLFEQSQGMLVCIATEAYTSAEAIARVVIEGSINLMYMAQEGTDSTLVGFLESWLVGHNRKLKKWENHMKGTVHEKRVLPLIKERQELITSYELILDHIVSICEINRKTPHDVWPKSLFQRFSRLGRESDYYESYHRLSGSSHINGEDTFTYLVSLSASDEIKLDLAREAAAYSIMMSRIASIIFIDSIITCCISHGMKPENTLFLLRAELEESVNKISKAAGVPK